MADSTSPIQQVVAGSGAALQVNDNFASTSPAALYARDPVTSAGLTWGTVGGRFSSALVASATVALTASAINYLVALRTTGAISLGTLANWNDTANYARLYLITAGASTVTGYEDHRQAIAGTSALPVASSTVLGGVKVGAGLAVAGDGTLSASGAAPSTQTLTDFSNAVGTTTGLTYGIQAGVIRQDNVTTAVAAGTVALAASTTNYVELTGAGVASANAVGFTSGRYPLATVLTGASAITTITDKRGVISLGAGVQLGGVNVFTKNQSAAMVALTDAASVALDASLSNSFELLATAGVGATRAIANATNPTAGMVLNLLFYQDAAGARALTWGTAYQGPAGAAVPSASTAASAIDLYSMIYSAVKAKWIVNQTKGS
jgi:hypothetical protein